MRSYLDMSAKLAFVCILCCACRLIVGRRLQGETQDQYGVAAFFSSVRSSCSECGLYINVNSEGLVIGSLCYPGGSSCTKYIVDKYSSECLKVDDLGGWPEAGNRGLKIGSESVVNGASSNSSSGSSSPSESYSTYSSSSSPSPNASSNSSSSSSSSSSAMTMQSGPAVVQEIPYAYGYTSDTSSWKEQNKQSFFKKETSNTGPCAEQQDDSYCGGTASHYLNDVDPGMDPTLPGYDGKPRGNCGVGDGGTDFFVALSDAGKMFGGQCDGSDKPMCAQVSCGDVFEVSCQSLRFKGYSTPCTSNFARIKVVDACPANHVQNRNKGNNNPCATSGSKDHFDLSDCAFWSIARHDCGEGIECQDTASWRDPGALMVRYKKVDRSLPLGAFDAAGNDITSSIRNFNDKAGDYGAGTCQGDNGNVFW